MGVGFAHLGLPYGLSSLSFLAGKIGETGSILWLGFGSAFFIFWWGFALLMGSFQMRTQPDFVEIRDDAKVIYWELGYGAQLVEVLSTAEPEKPGRFTFYQGRQPLASGQTYSLREFEMGARLPTA